MRIGILVGLAAIAASAQTRVDVRTQSKNVDFSASGPTKPMQTGTALPATCTVGQLFFNTAAAGGANIYACTAANTWTLEGGAGGSGNLGVAAEGTIVGTRPVVNLIAGPGLESVLTDTGTQINVETSVDTATMLTQAGAQSGATLLCASTTGNSQNYQCALNPTAGAYSTGMVLHWMPDVSGSGGPTTLNVDTLGAVPVKLSDGVTDPSAGAIVAGSLYPVWYDRQSFRILAGAAGQSGGGNSGMVYPGAGVPSSTGTGWGASYTVGAGSGNLVQLNASGQLPAVSAALLTNFPTLNQNTAGTAGNLSGTPALPNGTTAATQSQGDGSAKLATTAYVDAGLAGKQAGGTYAGVGNCPSGQFATGTAAGSSQPCAQVQYSQIGGAVPLGVPSLPPPGASCTASGSATFCICTGTCTVTPPAPAAGYQFCARNDTGVSTVITLAALGAGMYYEKADGSGYGSSNAAMTSAGATGDRICLVGRDSAHWQVYGYQGTWTAN